jgi:hypothetical protein
MPYGIQPCPRRRLSLQSGVQECPLRSVSRPPLGGLNVICTAGREPHHVGRATAPCDLHVFFSPGLVTPDKLPFPALQSQLAEEDKSCRPPNAPVRRMPVPQVPRRVSQMPPGTRWRQTECGEVFLKALFLSIASKKSTHP